MLLAWMLASRAHWEIDWIQRCYMSLPFLMAVRAVQMIRWRILRLFHSLSITLRKVQSTDAALATTVDTLAVSC